MCTFTYIIDLYLIHTRTLSLGFQSILFIFLPLLILYIETTCGAVKIFSNRSFVLYWKRYISTVKYMCTWMNFLFFCVFLTVRFFYTCREELPRMRKRERGKLCFNRINKTSRYMRVCVCYTSIRDNTT